jgi:beta-lactamase class D
MIVRDIMVRSATSNYVLRAKTGYAYPAKIGWYVGWVERGDRSLYFATLLYQLEWAHGGKRQSVTERLLKSLGWI